jgi:hypothetical protein
VSNSTSRNVPLLAVADDVWVPVELEGLGVGVGAESHAALLVILREYRAATRLV